MLYLFVFTFFLCFVFIVPFRVLLLHPLSTPLYAFQDLYFYFKHRKYDLYTAGRLDCYSAHFGGGKTLSIVQYVSYLYSRYNNKKVWDSELSSFVTQKILIISNVEFTLIPFVPLEGLSQVVSMCTFNKELDKENFTRTCIIVVIDEASAQLNSRNFKSNINPDFLNTLITSRHYHMSILYSSQKFKLTDKLMRDVTQRVIQCKKIWRVLVQYEYVADDLEYAVDPSLVRPKKTIGIFIRNKHFRAYDTLAVVGKLNKDVNEGNMLSEAEIIALRDSATPDNDLVSRPSRKLSRRRKRSAT